LRNYWLDIAFKRKMKHRIKAIVSKAMRLGGSIVLYNESNIDKSVEYTLQLIQNYGYSKAMDEIEKIIETAVSIDKYRFVMK